MEVLTEDLSRFTAGATLAGGVQPDAAVTMAIETASMHQGRMLVKFEGVDDRTQAEALQGTLLFVDSNELKSTDEDAFWEHELVGMQVVDEEGRSVGVMAEVFQRKEQDLWRIEREGRDDIYIPATKAIVRSVDRTDRRIIVELPRGLAD